MKTRKAKLTRCIDVALWLLFILILFLYLEPAEAYEYDQNGVRIAGSITADDYQQQFDLDALRVQQEEQHQEIQRRLQEQENIIEQLELQNNYQLY